MYANQRPTVLVDPSGLRGSIWDLFDPRNIVRGVKDSLADTANCIIHVPGHAVAACRRAWLDWALTLATRGAGGRVGRDALKEVAEGDARRTWPSTPEEMDKLLGIPGKRVPDGPTTPGRNKVEWEPNKHTTITFEQHPYHKGSPIEHSGPHWHLDTPGRRHVRHLPGDPIPGG